MRNKNAKNSKAPITSSEPKQTSINFKDSAIIAAIIGGIFLLFAAYISTNPFFNCKSTDDSKVAQKVYWLPDKQSIWRYKPGIVVFPQNDTIMWPQLKQEIDCLILPNLDNYYVPKIRRTEFDPIANVVKVYNRNDSDVVHLQFGWNGWCGCRDSIIRVTSTFYSSLKLYATFARYKDGSYQMIPNNVDTSNFNPLKPYKEY
jgi:hypothetical protein